MTVLLQRTPCMAPSQTLHTSTNLDKQPVPPHKTADTLHASLAARGPYRYHLQNPRTQTELAPRTSQATILFVHSRTAADSDSKSYLVNQTRGALCLAV